MKRLVILIVVLFFSVNPAKAGDLPLVGIVSTGGTIAQKVDPKTGASVPALSGEDLAEAIPGVKDLARLTVIPQCNIDSSQMTPQVMLDLAHTVQKQVDDPAISAVLVTHGTDTMEETSYFLDLVVKTDKPVIFVGAQHNASDPFPDGPGNLANALVQAVSPQARNLGVTVTMNQYVCDAEDVRKTHTDNLMTFSSMNRGILGYVDFGQFRLFRKPARQERLPLPKKDAALPDVMLFTMYAGADGKFLRKAVDEGAAGLVVAAFGLGNVNKSVYEAILYAREKDVPVVISSRCYTGRTYPVYGGPGGGKTLSESKVIFSGGRIPSKSRILLMLALAAGKKGRELEALFQ